jgi:hypothetical protein
MRQRPPTLLRVFSTLGALKTYLRAVVASMRHQSHLRHFRPLAGSQTPIPMFGGLGVFSFSWPDLPGWVVAAGVVWAFCIVAAAGFVLGVRDGRESKRLEHGVTLADVRTRVYRLRRMLQGLSVKSWRDWESADDELEAILLETRAAELPRPRAPRRPPANLERAGK